MPTKPRRLLWLFLATAVTANATPLVVDTDRSRVQIAVHATVGSFVADLRQFEAQITATKGSGQIETAFFRARFATIATGNAGRDRDMNDWQQSDRYPDVVFTLAALEQGPGGTTMARGRLSLHGVERAVDFPVTIVTRPPLTSIDGDVVIDTRDYGLPVISKFLLLRVDPLVHVRFHLEGELREP